MICALIDEGKNDVALEVAREIAPSAYQGLCADGNFNDRVNFYELTILHLAGRPAFRDEVLKRSVPFDTNKLPISFDVCHFNSDSELQIFEEGLRPYATKLQVNDQVRLALAWVICKRVEIGVHIDSLKENAMEAKKFLDSIADCSQLEQRNFSAFEARLERLLEKVGKLA